jgi:glyoxylase-like metal-dependent hydrolase (beta-lactamase superfamily II)
VLVESIPAQVLATNCWVVAPADGELAVIIDPGGGLGDRLTRFVDAHKLTPAAVLVTHGHFDHTMSAAEVSRMYDVGVYLHAADRWQLHDPWAGIGLLPGTLVPELGSVRPVVPDQVTELRGGEALELGALLVHVVSAPGHTPGSVVYTVSTDGVQTMFTGDFLFAGSIGRMDLPGGDEERMRESLRATVRTAPPDALVRPGHGPSSTIGRELQTNPFLQDVGWGQA